MRFTRTRSISHRAALAAGVALLGGWQPMHAAEDDASDKKPGLMHRIFGGGDKEKKEEAKAPPPPPEPKKSSSKAKSAPKEEPASKPKPKASTPAKEDPPAKPKPKASTASKDDSSGKPKSKIVFKPSGDGTAPSKLVTVEGSKTGPKTATERSLDSKFGKTTLETPVPVTEKPDEQPRPSGAASETDVAETNIALPPIDSAFEVVKYDGRDYVTMESIHRFYRFSSFRVDGNHVILSNPTLILKADIGSQEMFMNNIKFILSYPMTTVGGKPAFSRLDLCKLIDPVLLPSHISDADPFDTVVVDAGHGGHDSGARGVYGYEKDFTLQMAQSVKGALSKRGLKVVMTRSTDEFISLSGRAAIANATPNCIFVSLHFNSSGPAASGIETFALSPQGSASTFMGERSSDYQAYTGNHRDSANIALATAVHAMVIHRFKLVDRGIKRARWSVLTGCNRPGILFEGGFVTNGTECRLIASSTYREAVANAIGDAVVNYRRALQPRMAQPSLRRTQ